MDKITKYLGGIVFYIFAILVVLWTASLSLQELRLIFPNETITPYLSLILFDVGAFAWGLTFLHKSKGTPQRGISIGMTGIDLLGVALLVVGRIFSGGQQLADQASELDTIVLWSVIGVAVLNLVAIYAFHLNDPQTRKEIALQNMEDEQFEESLKQQEKLFHIAMQQTKGMLERDGHKLAQVISKRAYLSIKYQMNLGMTKAEQLAWEKDAIDADFEEIPTAQLPAPANANMPSLGSMFGGWLKSFFGQRVKGYTNLNSTSQPLPQSLNEQDQNEP